MNIGGLFQEITKGDMVLQGVILGTIIATIMIALSVWLLKMLYAASLLKKMGKQVNPLVYIPLCNEIGVVKSIQEENDILLPLFDKKVDKNILFINPIINIAGARIPKSFSTVLSVLVIYINFVEYNYIYEIFYKEKKTGLAIVSAIFPIVYLVELILMNRRYEGGDVYREVE